MNSTFSEANPRDNVIPVEVLGISFTIRTDEDPEYIRDLVSELRDRLARVSSQMKIVDPLRLAVMTNLLTLDELRNPAKRAAPRKEGAPREKIPMENAPRETAAKEAVKESEEADLLESLDRRLGELGL